VTILPQELCPSGTRDKGQGTGMSRTPNPAMGAIRVVPIPVELLIGMAAQPPAKGWGVFGPGLDPEEECAKDGVRLCGPERAAGRDRKGKPSAPSGFASGTRKTRKASRAFRLASPAEREREGPPRSGKKPSPLTRPAPPKEGPFDRGIGGGETPGSSGLALLSERRKHRSPRFSAGARCLELASLSRRMDRPQSVTQAAPCPTLQTPY